MRCRRANADSNSRRESSVREVQARGRARAWGVRAGRQLSRDLYRVAFRLQLGYQTIRVKNVIDAEHGKGPFIVG